MRRSLPPLAAAVSLLLAAAASGQPTFPPRPGQRDFICDQAAVLSDDQAAHIRGTCDRLLTDTATPIVVVTLPGLADFAPDGMSQEDYSRELFNHWGVGHQPANTGILVLWVRETGRIRVELGRGWGTTRNDRVKQILTTQFRPRRERGESAAGLVATVDALAEMAREPPAAASTPVAPASSAAGLSGIGDGLFVCGLCAAIPVIGVAAVVLGLIFLGYQAAQRVQLEARRTGQTIEGGVIGTRSDRDSDGGSISTWFGGGFDGGSDGGSFGGGFDSGSSGGFDGGSFGGGDCGGGASD